jgi:hypothetical protein
VKPSIAHQAGKSERGVVSETVNRLDPREDIFLEVDVYFSDTAVIRTWCQQRVQGVAGRRLQF